MLKELKEFTMKGNVIDMAIGIISGTDFGKIIASLVSDVLMPPKPIFSLASSSLVEPFNA